MVVLQGGGILYYTTGKFTQKPELHQRQKQQVLAFQKSWRSFSPIIVCILAHCMHPFPTLDSTFFLKLMPENQGHSGRLTVYVQTL